MAYEGHLVVATDEGDIVVTVEAGEAAEFLDRPDGRLASLSDEASRIVRETGVRAAEAGAGRLSEAQIGILAACGVWLNAVAGPGVYWDSIDGCAVVGHPGYWRQYAWSAGGDFLVCVQARGWNPGAVWYGIGCSSTGTTMAVPWGNSLAYTKVRALAAVTISPIGYSWLT